MQRFMVAIGLLVALPAAAQDGGEAGVAGRPVQYQKVTELEFRELELPGELVRPSGGLVIVHKQAEFNPLIVLRSDFAAELEGSVVEVR